MELIANYINKQNTYTNKKALEIRNNLSILLEDKENLIQVLIYFHYKKQYTWVRDENKVYIQAKEKTYQLLKNNRNINMIKKIIECCKKTKNIIFFGDIYKYENSIRNSLQNFLNHIDTYIELIK
jgi:hypothetical protein